MHLRLLMLTAFIAVSLHSQDAVIKPSHGCVGCPKIVVHGKLARILKISSCEGISGMTCRIQFAKDSVLPSRIIVRQLDEQGKSVGNKYLPYPNLKPGEKGRTSFPVGSAETVVLTGEFRGTWRSAY